MIRTFLIIGFVLITVSTISAQNEISKTGLRTIEIFRQADIYFSSDDTTIYKKVDIYSSDNGRVINADIELPVFEQEVRIIASLKILPIPKDELVVFDKWDRAGNIRLSKEGMADIEIIKFITAYGGTSEYEVDVSHLAPVLQGSCSFKGFIDTWVSPAWKIDFSLGFQPVADSSGEEIYIDYIINPDWLEGVLFEQSYTTANAGDTGIDVEVVVPQGINRIVLYYFVSGHCTDGSGADEFMPKDNVIYVDNRVVHRFQPWRDDCRNFRDQNPYTRRWSDGYWSSDYSRSGWCPGDKVDPFQIDLTDHLTAGRHNLRFVIENVRPENDKQDYGYWRISGYLAGWEKKVNLVKW